MAKNDIKSEALLALKAARSFGVTQDKIARATGYSQSQVSRILSGRSVRRSSAFVAICKYAMSQRHGVSKKDVAGNGQLMDALASVWDGTPSHAAAIATIIRSLGVFRSN